jgi:hypothetical protein
MLVRCMPVFCAVGCTCEPIEDRSRVSAASVVSHSVREYECALFADEEVASQLKHVRRKAQKTLSLGEELEVSPVERRGQHRTSQPRATHTPSSVGLPRTIKYEGEWQSDIV